MIKNSCVFFVLFSVSSPWYNQLYFRIFLIRICDFDFFLKLFFQNSFWISIHMKWSFNTNLFFYLNQRE